MSFLNKIKNLLVGSKESKLVIDKELIVCPICGKDMEYSDIYHDFYCSNCNLIGEDRVEADVSCFVCGCTVMSLNIKARKFKDVKVLCDECKEDMYEEDEDREEFEEIRACNICGKDYKVCSLQVNKKEICYSCELNELKENSIDKALDSGKELKTCKECGAEFYAIKSNDTCLKCKN